MGYYNSNFKCSYIQDVKDRYKYASQVEDNIGLLFRRVEDWEKDKEKDIYDWSVEEIIEFYKWLSTPSLESLMIMNNQYKLYAAFALKNGMIRDNQNHFDEIDLETLNTCVNYGLIKRQIITRKNLLDILTSSDVENISDQVIALAIFEGIGGKNMEELTALEPTDINIQTKEVSLISGRKFKISDKLIAWCFESADEYNYYNSMSKISNKSYLLSDTRVIKRLSNSTVDSVQQRHKTINRRLDHIKALTNCGAFAIGALRESGRLEMIRNLRNSGLSLDEALKNDEMTYRYGIITSRKRYCLKFGLSE